MTPTEQRAEQLMRELVSLTNSMGSESDVIQGMLRGLTSEHRTLQQLFMGCMAETIRQYGGQSFYDMRNEDAVKWAEEVGCIETNFRFI
jgi:hypothetical protein